MQHAISNRYRPISLFAHGALDYLFGLLLLASPWIFGFSEETAARETAVAVGVLTLIYSVMTDYEAGLARLLPFRAHLWLDAMLGLGLAIVPWLIPISPGARGVLVGFGCVSLAVMLLTRRPHPNMPS